ncbi:deaminase domain-containing protein [Actinoallomurus sp. NPDC052274]|uniref:deaminase domain-containing protein n=1 Tax=Actinoallomurus sp. NPDC052274 TaxID=3155420 RepID=UPI0034410C76
MGRGKKGRYKAAVKAGEGAAKGVYKKLGVDRMLPKPRGGPRGHGPLSVRHGKSDNPRFKNLVERNKELRSRLPNSKKESNVATSDFHVYDKNGRSHTGTIDAVSGKKNYADRGFTDVDRSGPDIFPNRNAGRHSREYDSEKKIYEDFARKFPDTNTRGRITLYTERHPCPACARSTQDFLQRYPNMKVDIAYTYREGAGPLTEGRQNNFVSDPANSRINVSHHKRART